MPYIGPKNTVITQYNWIIIIQCSQLLYVYKHVQADFFGIFHILLFFLLPIYKHKIQYYFYSQ